MKNTSIALIALMAALHGGSAFAQGVPAAPGSLPPGLYVQVIDGVINLSNSGGSQAFTAGQFGYVASAQQPPVIVPQNPGMKFTPPPSFSTSSAPPGTATASKSNTVDCEVR